MKVKILFLITLFLFPLMTELSAKKVERKNRLENQSLTLNEPTDLHVTDEIDPMRKSKVNLISEDAWLFFDNLIPSEVIRKYSQAIQINGKPFISGTGGNARIAIYKQGAVIIPHTIEYKPLETFPEQGFNGISNKYLTHTYYTNKPSEEIPKALSSALEQDNGIRSFKLKRGYMATFATEPDGLGYSRIFIADTADINLPEMPIELDGRISYIRVFPWQWPSKKGWSGGRGHIVESNGWNRQTNEIALTKSTWFYSWGISDPLCVDAEFVPMKWGYGGYFGEINARREVTHLLGYNEPNRPDQSNMSVEQAIEEWPRLMKSGLRLGSPSVSDNSRLESWLYQFMDECDEKGYRVDYVAVHAYWGPEQMRTPEDWYKKLREIHLRTKRPIWITEWNIGANWTNEPWPSDRTEQEAKQLRDLKNVLAVLDTASFIERYSIYNWVEDKRAMIRDTYSYKTVDGKDVADKLLKQEMTPAGEFYRDNRPRFAFKPEYEVISKWKINGEPVLTYDVSERNEIQLHWKTNAHSEMINYFMVERSWDNQEFEETGRISPPAKQLYFEALMNADKIPSGSVYYRIQPVDFYGKKSQTSNTVSYTYLKNSNKGATIGNLISPADWSLFVFEQKYDKEPVIVFGTPTNRNKTPQTHRIKNSSGESFEFKFDTWSYLKNPVFISQDTIAYMVLPAAGSYNFGGIKAFGGKATGVTADWIQVNFETPFEKIPVVFASQLTDKSDSTSSVRIRNVTNEGFEVKLQYEGTDTPPNVGEELYYIALTPGKGLISGKTVEVGRTEEFAVGDFWGAGKIEFENKYTQPAFFGAMQTESDGIASALRIKNRGVNYTEVFKEKEMSKASKSPSKETVGWMVVEIAKE